VSEEALSDFERRGQPLREVFDSVFSDILHVDRVERELAELRAQVRELREALGE
jgi:cell shape-determining protein MreC